MRGKLKDALSNVDMMYSDLVEIANKIIVIYTKEIDELILDAYNNVNNLSNDAIRNLMLKLSLKSYSFGDTKEKSLLKSKCAEAIKKETYAVKFNETDGTVAFKENTATIETSDEIVSNAIYDLVANLFKTKLSELHLVIDALKVVLTTRMAEAKLSVSANA